MTPEPDSPSKQIEAQFKTLQTAGDWRGDTLAHLRRLIQEADPDVVEQLKWRKPSNPGGVPTYAHDGLIGTLEYYTDKVKFTFAKGNEIEDPSGAFTGGFGGKRRVIDLFEGDAVDDEAFKALIRAAIKINGSV